MTNVSIPEKIHRPGGTIDNQVAQKDNANVTSGLSYLIGECDELASGNVIGPDPGESTI